MAAINVNPTRLELMKLKKRLSTARRGHRLLKDKRDELMRQFLDKIKENLILRQQVEQALSSAVTHMAIAAAVMSKEQIETALMMTEQRTELDIKKKNVMGIEIPAFDVKYKISDKNGIYSYGYAFTSGELDEAVRSYGEILKKLIALAEIEKSCQLMADEIEKTRRRVNALEHIMIPRYEETIRYISAKLEENERSTVARLMKVKH